VANGIFSPGVAGVGSYNITYAYTAPNGCADTATNNMEVLAPPTVSLAFDTSLPCNDTTQVLLMGDPPGGTYTGLGVIGGTFYPAIVGIGTYTLGYAFTDAQGCGDTTYKAITVQVCSGIDQPAAAQQINIYPNPANNRATVTWLPTAGEVQITVTDLLGREVQTQSTAGNQGKTELQLGQMANGLYLVQLTFANGTHATGRLAVDR
jgi:hypothetical protein